MHRRQFLKTAASAVCLSLLSQKSNAASPPNVILIMADDLGYECLGCNGSTVYKTPRLDQLAETGVRFTHAHSQPLCTPSRVQIMTGKYNFRNYTEFGALKPGEYTFGHLLQDAGYKTCVIGKWQLAARVKNANYRGEGTLPKDAGFDEFCLWQINVKGSRYWEPTININGELREKMAGRYGPDVFCDYGLDFIERHKDQPFFVYFPMAITHDPFVPTPDSDLTEKDRKNVAKIKSDVKYFADMVAYMDKMVGRIVDKLEELGLRENTLLMFTGDNGTHRSVTSPTKDGDVQGAKGKTVITGTHVPLVANQPGTVEAGVVCENLIDFTDSFPTLADATGAQIPHDFPRDGRSFLPQLKGETGEPRDWIFCHYDPRWGNWQPARFVMDKKWKLYEDGRFFNVEKDPLEQQPIQHYNDDMEKVMEKFKNVFYHLQE
jgi:arylsulfatase A-like enzyme